MKTKSERIDNNANLIDYLAEKYVYEIMQVVALHSGERGVVLIKASQNIPAFLSKTNLLSMDLSPTVRGLLSIVNSYSINDEIVLSVVDEDGNKLLATALLGIGWKTINLKGE